MEKKIYKNLKNLLKDIRTINTKIVRVISYDPNNPEMIRTKP